MIKTNLKQRRERPIWLRLIIIILLVSGLSSSAIAQTSSIKGRIIDSKTQEKLMFVNCVLTDSKNNAKQIDGVAADTNGVFVFKNIKKKDIMKLQNK